MSILNDAQKARESQKVEQAYVQFQISKLNMNSAHQLCMIIHQDLPNLLVFLPAENSDRYAL